MDFRKAKLKVSNLAINQETFSIMKSTVESSVTIKSEELGSRSHPKEVAIAAQDTWSLGYCRSRRIALQSPPTSVT